MTAEPSDRPLTGPWDHVVVELQSLRRRSGDPSFGLIAQRISAQRRAGGADDHAARIARSTVYDTFRLGRSRINVDLVREVVAALDQDPAVVDAWLAARSLEPALVEDTEDTEEVTDVTDLRAVAAPTAATPSRQVLVLGVAFLGINLVGRALVDLLGLPVYLDMVGTAAAAVILGPWHGVAVGALTSVAGTAVSGPDSLLFLHVEVVGALAWGYGVRRRRWSSTLPGFFALCAWVGLICSALAVPVIYFVLPEPGGTGATDTIRNISDLLQSRALGTAVGNVTTSLVDKLVCGFAALALLAVAPASVRRRSPLRSLTGPVT